jgi:hypothetical protein
MGSQMDNQRLWLVQMYRQSADPALAEAAHLDADVA